ncbi:MAG: glycosyltransferase [Pseudomonadota bacterium]
MSDEVDVAEIDRQMADAPSRVEKWSPLVLLKLWIYFGICFALLLTVPNPLYDPDLKEITFVMGILGIWRYGWWFVHAVRAFLFGRFAYPTLRDAGEKAWEDGWRPRHLHFMMTTYKEHREITERVVGSIIREIQTSAVPGTIWLGSSDRSDEDIISDILRRRAGDHDITLRIIRQNVPGKRAAIGIVLRAMSRANVRKDDLVVFMDGDFVLAPGAIRKCLPLFGLYPDLQACTTDEEVICLGPKWVRSWLTMRFAQRRLAMQSHALSGRVLTLTGRMSVFRANHLLKREFIRLLEADHLEHWLWGKFRFLSGDDKSTWYYLLSQNARMIYVPDALGFTIEVIEGTGLPRMVQNFKRWSGNMLRNGMRAMMLGPKRMPFFIWWCLVDQRLSMWTMLVSPTLALCASIVHGFEYLAAYAIFIAISRMLLSLFLYQYSRRVDLSFPWILYFNQLINAGVKVYCLWRLAKQKWSNRGNQSAGFSGGSVVAMARDGMAMWCTALSVALLMLGTMLYTGLVEIPSAQLVRLAIFH